MSFVIFLGRSHLSELDISQTCERCFDGNGSTFDCTTPAGPGISDDSRRDRAAAVFRCPSRSLSWNNSTSNSNNFVEGKPTSSKTSTVAEASRKELSETEGHGGGRAGKSGRMSSGQVIKAILEDRKNDGRRTMRRRRTASTSAQTLPNVDELDDSGTLACGEVDPGHAEQDDQEAVGTFEEDLNRDDRRRLTLSRVLAASRQQSRRPYGPAAATVLRYSHLHHHRHHLHHYQHQNQRQFQPCRQQTRRLVHSSSSGCASCNMGQPDFRSPVVITSARETTTSHLDSCSRFSAAPRSRSVTFARHSPPSTPVLSPPAGPAARHVGSDGPSATRGKLTEEGLRQRIERILVEMRPRDEDQDSKIVAALRQALVDSSEFPTHLAD